MVSAPRLPLGGIPPLDDVVVPEALRRFGPLEPAWRNELGGLTFRGAGVFVKWSPSSTGVRLGVEVERLRWAIGFHRVPEVLEHAEVEGGEALVTRALPGDGAVTADRLARPRETVRAVGEGLRALHDDLPVESCPFDWSIEARIRGRRVAGLPAAPSVDRLVVCHGDACAPNTVIGADGRWVGHVDLGSLGVADRWADLAVASMSLGWNYGPGWESEFFAAYGIEPDAERIAFYRAFWDAEDEAPAGGPTDTLVP